MNETSIDSYPLNVINSMMKVKVTFMAPGGFIHKGSMDRRKSQYTSHHSSPPHSFHLSNCPVSFTTIHVKVFLVKPHKLVWIIQHQ